MKSKYAALARVACSLTKIFFHVLCCVAELFSSCATRYQDQLDNNSCQHRPDIYRWVLTSRIRTSQPAPLSRRPVHVSRTSINRRQSVPVSEPHRQCWPLLCRADDWLCSVSAASRDAAIRQLHVRNFLPWIFVNVSYLRRIENWIGNGWKMNPLNSAAVMMRQ